MDHDDGTRLARRRIVLVDHLAEEVALARNVGIVHALLGADLEQRLTILFIGSSGGDAHACFLDDATQPLLVIQKVCHLYGGRREGFDCFDGLAKTSSEPRTDRLNHLLCLWLIASTDSEAKIGIILLQQMLQRKLARESSDTEEQQVVFRFHYLLPCESFGGELSARPSLSVAARRATSRFHGTGVGLHRNHHCMQRFIN